MAGRGGKRSGAGRPCSRGGRARRRITYRLTDGEADALEQLAAPGESLHQTARRLLLEELQEQGTKTAPAAPWRFTFEEGRDEYDGTERDLWLFLGTGWKDDVAYRDELQRLDDERDNFHFVPTLSREEYLSDWEGETAYVQQTLLKYVESEAVEDADLPPAMARIADESPNYDIESRIDPENAEVYACGTNVMVEGLLSAVENVGVPKEWVESEGYG